jgi:hypothetical protein
MIQIMFGDRATGEPSTGGGADMEARAKMEENPSLRLFRRADGGRPADRRRSWSQCEFS